MNLRDLRYLLALYDHRNFGAAAKASHISQPTLSMQIKKLESFLGRELIGQRRRGVTFTSFGEYVVRLARQSVEYADAIVSLSGDKQSPESIVGIMRLGTFPTLAPYLFSALMPKLRNHFPHVIFQLVEEKTEILKERLLDGTLDAAFLALPVHHAALHIRPLWSEAFDLAVSPHHTLADQHHIDISHLEHCPLLLLEEGHCLRDQALDVCHSHAIPEFEDFRATSLETLRHMVVVHPHLATLMPRSAKRSGDGLHYMDITPTPRRDIALVMRKNNARNLMFWTLETFLDQQKQTMTSIGLYHIHTEYATQSSS